MPRPSAVGALVEGVRSLPAGSGFDSGQQAQNTCFHLSPWWQERPGIMSMVSGPSGGLEAGVALADHVPGESQEEREW